MLVVVYRLGLARQKCHLLFVAVDYRWLGCSATHLHREQQWSSEDFPVNLSMSTTIHPMHGHCTIETHIVMFLHEACASAPTPENRKITPGAMYEKQASACTFRRELNSNVVEGN
jgi:hypothetical protein